jgi:RsmE family RNA methyltransferase
MSYFFTPQMPEDGLLTGSIVDHLISTRIQPDQIINITDLQGSRWQVKLVHIDKKAHTARVSLIEYEYIKQSIAYPAINNTLMQAQIDKAYLEKMFEVLPFSCFDRVVLFGSQYSPKQSINMERLDKILTRSLEQSQRIYKPEIILEESTLSQLTESKYSKNRTNLVLDTQSSQKINRGELNNATVWIGPEGGWSPTELESFGNQYQRINLGNIIYPAWLCSLAIR